MKTLARVIDHQPFESDGLVSSPPHPATESPVMPRSTDNTIVRRHPSTVQTARPSNGEVFRGHLTALDGIRGLAILMILLLHFVGDTFPTNAFEHAVITVTGYGAYGVDLFFILSGFLITGILFDSRFQLTYFSTFYIRRVLRIFPLYYAVLAALFLVAPLIPALRTVSLNILREHQAWAWLYGVNIYDALKGQYSLPYLDHFWSLSVEEHFYFVWPMVIRALGRRPQTLMGLSLVIAAYALVARIVASCAGVSPITIFVLTPFRLDALCLGSFLAIYVRQPEGVANLKRWIAPTTFIAAMALVIAFSWNLFSDVGVPVLRPVRSSIFLVLLGILMLHALTAPAGTPSARFFRSSPMVFLGKYSYGLYVFHLFFAFYLQTHRTEFPLGELLGLHFGAVLLQSAVGIAASIAAAVLSYEVFEKRFLLLKRHWSAEKS